jgi:hypothetical protein
MLDFACQVQKWWQINRACAYRFFLFLDSDASQVYRSINLTMGNKFSRLAKWGPNLARSLDLPPQKMTSTSSHAVGAKLMVYSPLIWKKDQGRHNHIEVGECFTEARTILLLTSYSTIQLLLHTSWSYISMAEKTDCFRWVYSIVDVVFQWWHVVCRYCVRCYRQWNVKHTMMLVRILFSTDTML